jgi:hypothetical protein
VGSGDEEGLELQSFVVVCGITDTVALELRVALVSPTSLS